MILDSGAILSFLITESGYSWTVVFDFVWQAVFRSPEYVARLLPFCA